MMPVNTLLAGSISNTLAGINPAVLDHAYKMVWPPAVVAHVTPGPLLAGPGSFTPVSSVSLPKVGAVVSGFAGDWYNRIHVTPNNVNVGNLMTLQTREVTVWNAYTVPKTLNQVLETADSGVTLVQPAPAPLAFAPLQSRVYLLKVSLNGPPIVQGSFLFDFGFTTLTLNASGNRIVVWPYSPQNGVTEALEWKTDIIRAKAGEQRIALRDAPRQSFSYSHFMDDRQMTMARAMAVGWAQRQFGVPNWTDATYVGAVTEGQTSLQVAADIADYRVGEPILIWEHAEKYEAVGLEAKTSDTLTFSLPLGISMQGAYVMPLRYARSKGLTFKREASQRTIADIDFDVTLNVDLSAGAGLPTLNGLDVLTDTMHLVGSYDERIEKQVAVIDNGFGMVVYDPLYLTTDQQFYVSWSFRSRAEQWRVRRWLYSLKGKQKAFWLPSNTVDLELVMDASASAQSINVKSIRYALYYTTHAIQIKRTNGVSTYHAVTGGTTNGDVDTLSLAAVIGVDADIHDVTAVNFMHRVRLDADRIEITHDDSGFSTIKVPVIEVAK